MTAFTPNVDLTAIKRLFGAVEQPGGFVVSDIISPVIEIQDLALMQRREVIRFFSNLSVVSGVVGTTVPDGEFWLVHLVTTQTDILDADQALLLQLMLIFAGSGATFRYDQPVSVAALEAGGVGRVFAPPMILPPQTLFGVVANGITPGASGSIALALTIQLTRVTQ